MQHVRKHWVLILASLLLLCVVGWYAWPAATSATEASLYARVKQGTFKVIVTTTGELRASKFVEITGPNQARDAGMFSTKILSIVPEGTIVKTGDVIADLDRAPLAAKVDEQMLTLQKSEASLVNAGLDSALQLAQAREDVRAAEDGLEEKKLLKEQAKYEAPSIKRQAEIDYEKAGRAVEQAKRSFATKKRQAIAGMSTWASDVQQQRSQLAKMQTLMADFTIRSPTPGMVIYAREWNGAKKRVGSSWTPWDPNVATLPDLRQMESTTYVNEVDIRKIAPGQKVQITLDADANKKLDGVVTRIANMGEQRPNQDARVFEVVIQITQQDTTLRPGLTTANLIETASFPNVLFVPLEAVVHEGGFSYVYKKDGHRIVKQMIDIGASNDDAIIVRRGLSRDDLVLLSVPADKGGIKTETIPGLKPRSESPPSDVAAPAPVPVSAPVSAQEPAQESMQEPAPATP